jgi:hypothetical protein
MSYTNSKQTNFPFFHGVHIGELCVCVMNIMRWDLCYQYYVIGTGTSGGSDPIHRCYKEGYFHYGCGNLHVFIWLDWKIWEFWARVQFICHYCDMCFIVTYHGCFTAISCACIPVEAFRRTCNTVYVCKYWYHLNYFICYVSYSSLIQVDTFILTYMHMQGIMDGVRMGLLDALQIVNGMWVGLVGM